MPSETAVLAAVWAVMEKDLLGSITTKGRPELKGLRRTGESFESWLMLSAEEVLVRWIDHFVPSAGVDMSSPVESVLSDIGKVSLLCMAFKRIYVHSK